MGGSFHTAGRALAAGAALVAAACATTAPPEPTPYTPGALELLPGLSGAYVPVASAATGRTYHVFVRTPDGYNPAAAETYPVVYVLDGDTLWPILAANHLFLTYDDGLPEAIVVGIAYGSLAPEVNRRDTDFMPPGADVAPGNAGASAFQRFLREELLPLVERNYRADPARCVLFGQSRGGSFVLYSALTEPDLFQGRIASNPAFAPTKDFFMGAPAAATRGDLKLLIASGENDRVPYRTDAQEWISVWSGRADAPWELRLETIPSGTHAANSADAYRAGMRWFFGGEN